MYELQIEDAGGVWVICVITPSLADWSEFRDACGGRDHVRAIDQDGYAVFEFSPGEVS